MSNGKAIDIRQAADAVDTARVALESAEQEELRARSCATDARNRYNEACRAFDTAVDELKKRSPRSTDWKRDS